MKKGKRGEIWVTHDEIGKARPYIIISSDDDEELDIDADHTLLKVTSQQPKNKYDIVIEEWEEAGLLKESVVRCSKIVTVNSKKLLFKVGKLTEADFEKVLETLKTYLKI